MRTAPERLLLRLEWRVLRRLDGRLQGGYRTVYRGSGTDFTGLRAYLPGDDARHIDWNVTARLSEPHLRVYTEDRELTVWLVLDRTASMELGAPGRGKQDVLAELAMVLAQLFSRGGNRVGALLYDTVPDRAAPGGRRPKPRTVPPGTGRPHVLRIGAELARPVSTRRSSTTDLAAMIDAVARLARRRSLVIVISDFIGDGDWTPALQRLAQRHEVAALRVVDTADDELPEAGLLVVEDAETGEQLIIDSSDPLLRGRLRAAAAERDVRIAAGLHAARVAGHRIDTADDLAQSLVKVIAHTQRRRT
jgi:uncharacterized protein (DUF58 family)